ncbi:hypothetical protein [Algoriphagus antarcticus]|nr:hypothetical protein [Algoriphagus antarcticus]
MITIISIIVPIFSLIIGAYYQKQRDRLLLEQETFFQKKRDNYFKVIEPIISMISNSKNSQEQGKVVSKILSNEYRKEVLSLSLYGNDEVVKAFNDMFQLIYDKEKYNENVSLLIPFLGKVLLEMRKELGNKNTKIDEFQILEFLIKDIKEMKSENFQKYKDIKRYLKYKK